jgi:hypothetical protein
MKEVEMSMNKAEMNYPARIATAMALSLGLTACGGGQSTSSETKASASAPASSPVEPSPTPTRDCAPNPDKKYGKRTFIFDDLCGSYPTVHVYAGPTNAAADKKPFATYRDNEPVAAECITTGREVASHPELHENEDVRSKEWVMFMANGVKQFATVVYAQDRDQLEKNLSQCTPAQLAR